MRFVDGAVFFKSDDPYYIRERSGRKSNTVRVLSENEYKVIIWNSVKEIEISNPATEQCFRRDITDISRIGGICGMHVMVFSWEHDGGKI